MSLSQNLRAVDVTLWKLLACYQNLGRLPLLIISQQTSSPLDPLVFHAPETWIRAHLHSTIDQRSVQLHITADCKSYYSCVD